MFANSLPARLLALAAALALTGSLAAQTQPPPRLNYVFPMGAKAGATVEITATGLDLAETESLHFSFAGVKVEVVGEPSKVKLDPKKTGKGMNKPAQGQSSQKFKVTIPANAPLGIHDVRIVTAGGVSNPRAFVVGDIQEVNETEPNDDVPKGQKVELNTTVNGLIPAGTDVDYYVFSGKKGQRVVLSCLTTSIDSKLPVEMQLYGPGGSYLGSSRGYQNNDALLDIVLQNEGEHYIRLCSFTYTQGGPEYFYRLTIATVPWIDAVYPPVVEPGKETKVTLYGRNLPGGQLDPASLEDGRVLEKATVTIKAPASAHGLAFRGFVSPTRGMMDGFGYSVKNETGTSNQVLVHLARAPVVLENRDNDTAEKAQAVSVPCEIAGMIEKKGDQDWYSFSAKKGQVLAIEAFGDRLGSPVDLYYVLEDDKGKQITRQDENNDTTANQFYTRTDDPPRYRFTVPADGDYRLMITSQYAFVQAGPRQVYSVRITPDEGNFQVIAMGTSQLNPETIALGQASNQVFNLLIFREGTVTGDITLSGRDLPPGISVKPQVISANQKQANLVISAAGDAPHYIGAIKVVATALVNGKKQERAVRSANITWPVAQNAPTISRLDHELVLAVRDKAPYTLAAETDKIQIPQGDKINIAVKVHRQKDFTQPVSIVALNLPTGMAQQPLTLDPKKDSGTVVIDNKGTILPGNYTLVLRGQTQPVNAKPNNNQKNKTEPGNYLQATSPIALTVVPKTLGKLSAPNNVKVVNGKDTEVVVRIARLNEYAGPFTLSVTGNKGLKVETGTIAAGKDEAKLTLHAEDAAPGTNLVVTIHATAMFNDTIPIVSETKLNVAITK